MEQEIDQFTCFTIRTDMRIIINLYKMADRNFDRRVEVLTDKIIAEYCNVHQNDIALTSYIGFKTNYRYNLQIRQSTRNKIREMAEKFNTLESTIAKAALMIWQIQL